MTRRFLLFLALLASSCGIIGCGSGDKLAPVHGKIVFNGKPVRAGSVLFAPKPQVDNQFEAGRPSTGAPDENGEFQMSTHRKNDGALIGTHTVIYSAPEAPTTNDPIIREKDMKLYKEFGGLRLPDNYTVEVKPGKNEFVLELTR